MISSLALSAFIKVEVVNYYELMGLRHEPFSLLPARDELFLRLDRYAQCLRKIEIAIWLRRGLNVVTGEVGAGKTSLCLQLVESLRNKPAVTTLHISEPYFTDEIDFLTHLNTLFGVDPAKIASSDIRQLRSNLREFLAKAYNDGQGLVVLVLDEGQHLSTASLELVRDLLNYEMNGQNLVQVIIFAQLEFEGILAKQANLRDRMNLHYRLGALSFWETRKLVLSRLEACSEKKSQARSLFTLSGLYALHKFSQGRPRRIMRLAHQSLLSAAVRGKTKVNYSMVRQCVPSEELRRGLFRIVATSLLLLFMAFAVMRWGSDAWTFVRISSVGQAIERNVTSLFRSSQVAVKDASPSAQGASSVAEDEEFETKTIHSAPALGKIVRIVPAKPSIGPEISSSEPSQSPQVLPGTSGEQSLEGQSSSPSSLIHEPASPLDESTHKPSPAEVHTNSVAPDSVEGRLATDAKSMEVKPSLTAVQLSDEGGKTYLLLQTSQPVSQFKAMAWGEPNRYVIDLLGAWQRAGERDIKVSSARIDKVKATVMADRLRVEVFLAADAGRLVAPEVKATEQGLRLVVK